MFKLFLFFFSFADMVKLIFSTEKLWNHRVVYIYIYPSIKNAKMNNV